MKKLLASLIDSIMVFGLMLGTGFIAPFRDDTESVHQDETEG